MKQFLRLVLLAAMAAAVAPAQSHGPTRQKVTETVAIKASPAAVWEKIKSFDALAQWHPAVAKSPATNGNAEGSVRNLTLKDGGTLEETLEGWSAERMSYKYRAKDGGALPVSNYTSTITVKPGEGGGAIVEWRGAFYRKFMNNDPPKGEDDEAAVNAVTGVYKSGLANLKKLAEQ